MSSVIARDPETCGGDPIFAGTRVPVRIFFECLRAGYTVKLFVDQYPAVKKEQAVALLDEVRMQIDGQRVAGHDERSAAGVLKGARVKKQVSDRDSLMSNFE